MTDRPAIDSSDATELLESRCNWLLQPAAVLPTWLIETLQLYNPLKVENSSASSISGSILNSKPNSSPLWGEYAAQLLWQRGLRDRESVIAFLDPSQYQPASPFEFPEMEQAVERLHRAIAHREQVAIWGDFDADGVTATALLWEGLGHWLAAEQLQYYIPNRFTESHGLSRAGLQQLAEAGVTLVVTCDTGSTNHSEIEFAHSLGLDLIITDHHSLAEVRPPVVALINPRSLPPDHPLASLSGVAVAYKLIEALQMRIPIQVDSPDNRQSSEQQPSDSLPPLLELVAIGLIADLVALKQDSRHLAQLGLQRLQALTRHPQRRPGVAELLKRCQRSGDRPTDISFGIGPRINAVSRIQGDARVCVELLTSRDRDRTRALADQVELLNTRRRALQRNLEQEVRSRLESLDLSTTAVIVLAEVGWPIGVLGLVAGQIAKTYGRPTVLLAIDPPDLDVSETDFPGLDSSDLDSPDLDSSKLDSSDPEPRLARGSARSVQGIDFYPILETQRSLLTRFGGHPFAAGLSLPVENLELLTEGLNRELRSRLSLEQPLGLAETITADLEVTVAELGQPLFRELKLLEPCGMGNPAPLLLIRNCWFENARHFNLKDARGGKVRYIKTQFELLDASSHSGFSGIWWGHYRDELPPGSCDVVGELDFNAQRRNYEFRLVAVRPAAEQRLPDVLPRIDWLLDWRSLDGSQPEEEPREGKPAVIRMEQVPRQWSDFRPWLLKAQEQGAFLALAYGQAHLVSPAETWRRLLGLAKYLSRTGDCIKISRLRERLGVDESLMELAWGAIADVGFEVYHPDSHQVQISLASGSKLSVSELSVSQLSVSEAMEQALPQNENSNWTEAERFLAALREVHFRQRYFLTVPLPEIARVSAQLVGYERSTGFCISENF